MFRFESPAYLYLLFIVPLLLFGFIFMMILRRNALKKIGEYKLIRALMPDVSTYRLYIKFTLILLCVAFLCIALARPQFGVENKVEKHEGIEVVVALDISNSMLAQDIKPNRLERAKRLVDRLVDRLQNDKIGLIVFAGDAFTQLPITADRVSAKMFLESISPEMISKQGTDIGQAVKLAMRSFTAREGVGRAIIIITDGESHEPGAVEAVEAAAKDGVQINVMGIGSLEGSPIPMGSNNDFQRDASGNVVITKLNQEMGEQIAKTGGGVFAMVDNSNSALNAIMKEIDRLEKSEIESTTFRAYSEQFVVLAWLTLLALSVEFFLLEGKNPIMRRINLFKKRV